MRDQEICQKIKNRRIELNLLLSDVAEAVGVNISTVSRWEAGEIANMGRDKVVKLAKVLKISPAVIMGWDENIEFHRSLDIESRFNDMLVELSIRNDAFNFGGQELTPNQVEMIKGMLNNTLDNIRLMVKLSK